MFCHLSSLQLTLTSFAIFATKTINTRNQPHVAEYFFVLAITQLAFYLLDLIKFQFKQCKYDRTLFFFLKKGLSKTCTCANQQIFPIIQYLFESDVMKMYRHHCHSKDIFSSSYNHCDIFSCKGENTKN